MSNELALKMSSDALQDFKKIDTGNKGYLNLLDIHNYENQGPQQKAVGQFLERNYDAIRTGISSDDDSHSEHCITIPDLEIVKQLSDSSKNSLTKDETAGVDVFMGGLYGAGGAALGLVGASAAALLAGAVFAPAAVPAFWATEAAETAGAAALAVWSNEHEQSQAQSTVDALK